MTDLHDLSAVEQARRIRVGELSALALTEHYLRRIDAHGAGIGAFVTLTADAARAQAADVDRRRQRGVPLPPLAGVPIGIKDLTRTAGVRTTFGSAAFADAVPDADDDVVVALRAAGTVSLGKTNTPEFGIPCYTEPDVAPPARTPWDLSRSASGSSGGAAAAVAAGLLPVAHGSDGGGSVRTPASVCGLLGVKPSRGRVSNGPRQGDVAALGCQGVIARGTGDAAAVLDAMTGDRWRSLTRAAAHPPERLRVGVLATPVLADTGLHPAVRAALTAAADLLAQLGHAVEEMANPFPPALTAHFETLWFVAPAAVPVTRAEEGRLRPLTRWCRERGRQVTAVGYLAALVAARTLATDALRALAGVDILLTPTLADLPRPVGALRDDGDPAADFAAQERFSPFCAPFNLTGQPAASVPLHWTADGLPVGVQLVGRPGGDATVLALCGQLESARPWASRHPELW